MIKYFCDLLYDSDLDLNLSVINKDDPLRFIVSSRIGTPRIVFSLLFGIPCLILIMYALSQHGIYLLLSLIFCPPLAILSLLFGLAKQQKTFISTQGKALKSFQLFQIKRDMEIQIPKNGILSTYKKWSTGGDSSGGCYFYHVEVQGIKGLGFCVARDEKKRDDFARDLADFLGYEIRDMGEMQRT